jgi:glycosyltransferase involved in cell wall biosynthesis
MRENLTVVILAFNERENIERTLGAVSWVPRVLVLDSFSTDDTVARARQHPNVNVVQRRFVSHAAQWNFGLSLVETEWVLSLDADYVLPRAMEGEIEQLVPTPETAGYEARFRYCIHGRPLRASVYPPRVILFRREACSYYDDGHTQRLRTNGSIGQLTAVIDHDDRKPLSRWIQSQDRYAILEARHLRPMPLDQLSFQDRLRRKVYCAPVMMFFYLLFVRGLILDGWPGWYYVFQRSIAEMLLSLRLLTQQYVLESHE